MPATYYCQRHAIHIIIITWYWYYYIDYDIDISYYDYWYADGHFIGHIVRYAYWFSLLFIDYLATYAIDAAASFAAIIDFSLILIIFVIAIIFRHCQPHCLLIQCHFSPYNILLLIMPLAGFDAFDTHAFSLLASPLLILLSIIRCLRADIFHAYADIGHYYAIDISHYYWPLSLLIRHYYADYAIILIAFHCHYYAFFRHYAIDFLRHIDTHCADDFFHIYCHCLYTYSLKDIYIAHYWRWLLMPTFHITHYATYYWLRFRH